MEKLISMTEFVLKCAKTVIQANSDYNKKQVDILFKIYNYANFLNKPLELGFFVPCDLDGNVLDVPNINEYKGMFCESGICKAYEDECKQYEEAQKRVLFKGCVKKDDITFEMKFQIESGGVLVYRSFLNGEEAHWRLIIDFNEFKKIEDLIDRNLTLTDNALKQIGI